MESIANHPASLTSLYRPVPVSTLQSNLAHFYQRTSKFVEEHFQEMVSAQTGQKESASSEETTKDTSKHRMNPTGMGGLLDIYG